MKRKLSIIVLFLLIYVFSAKVSLVHAEQSYFTATDVSFDPTTQI